MNNASQWTRAVLCCTSLALAAGCGRPSSANIELRKQNQALRDELAALKIEKAGLAKSLDATIGNSDPTTQADSNTTRPALMSYPALSSEQLANLFTTHDLTLGRLTGPSDLNPKQPGDDGLKIFVVPTDEQGDTLKAAGTFVVEAFDLSLPSQLRVGQWTFDLDQSRAAWHGQGLLYTYVLACPWQTAPTSPGEWTIKITFTDALTGRTFTKQTQVKVRPQTFVK